MLVSIKKIKPNPQNPRVIKDSNFKKLVDSIREFPEMMEKRPLVCYTDTDKNLVVLGGNMRLKAAQEIGLKELPVILADDWTAEQKELFIIRDNVSGGEWDFEALSNWQKDELGDWGVDVPDFAKEVDYSILDDDDEINQQLEDMTAGVKKAIQIEFEAEHYEEAYELVKFWRSQGDVGYMILQYLRDEKEKL
jgi:ParB-like chromosome segregation protein Spo0J